jgi:hypothetical protein
MPTYIRKSRFVMLKGIPENAETIESWGMPLDGTLDSSSLCFVFDQDAGLISDIISEEDFQRMYETSPDSDTDENDISHV